ncbi:MAG: hypothetical protein HW379_161 [Actinobacteria bacterium]|nr:hypothetical protein [Actinomycetota bacterium]
MTFDIQIDGINTVTYTNKTQPTAITPENYLKENFAQNSKVRIEALALVDFYTKVTGSPCVMWNKIFGFGKYHYLDSKGGEHEYCMTGFTISSTGFTLYNLMGWEEYKKDLEDLGKHKFSGQSCLAIKSIEGINLKILGPVVKRSLTDMKKRYRTEK